MKADLEKLFLNLNLEKSPKEMINSSNLKFNFGENRGVDWTGGNTKIYDAKFAKNELIESKILNGQILIKQNDSEIQKGQFDILQRIEFQNKEELINEFYSLTKRFEKFGFKTKETIIENENFEIKSQTNQILLNSDSKIAELVFGYTLMDKKLYTLIITYKNKIEK